MLSVAQLSTQGNDSPTSPLPPLEGAADEGGDVAEESAHAHVHVHAHGAARRAPGGGGGEANAQEQDAALPGAWVRRGACVGAAKSPLSALS